MTFGIVQKRPVVHNSVCSQFLESLFAILAECSQFCFRYFYYKFKTLESRGNSSPYWLGGGWSKGHNHCEQNICEQTVAFPNMASFSMSSSMLAMASFVLSVSKTSVCWWRPQWGHRLSGPRIARYRKTISAIPPCCALWGFWCLKMTN